jgi:hypothetical protein
MNKQLMRGVMLCLSIGTGFAADRVAENGVGIVLMPYESKAQAGEPFVISKDTFLVAQGAETKQCAAYLQQRLRNSCGLYLKTATTASGKAIVLTVSDDWRQRVMTAGGAWTWNVPFHDSISELNLPAVDFAKRVGARLQ